MPRMRNILVANRGEIAWRVMRTARALGYRVTAIYSVADTHSPHVAYADAAVCVGPAPVGASYLNVSAILAAARSAGADAVHPGYGLLSENADFAQACMDAGLTFIGPRPETIRLMGDKRRARLAVQSYGVPCVPGYDGERQDVAVLCAEAARIGFPIMVKAAAGGGGRGMRRVTDPAALPEAIARASSEAQKAFGDGRLILELAIDGARHVEVQVVADSHGAVIHLGERDCSVQRRFQKLIEEAPSPAVDATLRCRMGELAVRVAQQSNYLGVGTVELLLEPTGNFYFLEMNTRLQVEHPVTELVTGVDLVSWQLRIAEGEALPLQQAAITLIGHAIEARLYAEDPEHDFVPATGRVLQLAIPDELVRVDHTLAIGLVIGSHYDALLGKLIAHGPNREVARQKLACALRQLRLLGVRTNQMFMAELLEHPTFAAGGATTDFLSTQPIAQAPSTASPNDLSAAAVVLCLREQSASRVYPSELAGFSNCEGLRAALVLQCNGQTSAVTVARSARDANIAVGVGDQQVNVGVEHHDAVSTTLVIDGLRQRLWHAFDGERLFLHTERGPRTFVDVTQAPPQRDAAAGSGQAIAPMDGSVVDVLVQIGDPVICGQTLAVVEAMKLELKVVADVAGTVTAVHVARGNQVKARQLLVEIGAL